MCEQREEQVTLKSSTVTLTHLGIFETTFIIVSVEESMMFSMLLSPPSAIDTQEDSAIDPTQNVIQPFVSSQIMVLGIVHEESTLVPKETKQCSR